MNAPLKRTTILLSMLGLLALGGCAKEAPPSGGPPEVTVAKVLTKRIKDWDEFTGRFQAVDTVEVRPRVSGYIDQVLFREGQPVKKDDVLLIIDPRPYEADFERAKAGLELAKSQRELASLEAVRVQKLKDSGAVSREELDERLSTLHQQEANVAAAKAALDNAALNLSWTKVRAPVDGRASRAEVTRGNLVTGGNNGGTLLTTVVSVDPIYVYFEADENAYLHYNQLAREGSRPSSRDFKNPVRVGLANEEGFPHEGHMDFVDNQLDIHTGTMRGRAVLENKNREFTPGLFARIQLLGSGEYDALLIEDRAIGTDQSQSFVLVLGPDNKVEYRPIQPGRMLDGGMRIVRKGLTADDVIVVSGLQRVRPGAQVKPTVVAMATDANTTASASAH